MNRAAMAGACLKDGSCGRPVHQSSSPSEKWRTDDDLAKDRALIVSERPTEGATSNQRRPLRPSTFRSPGLCPIIRHCRDDALNFRRLVGAITVQERIVGQSPLAMDNISTADISAWTSFAGYSVAST